MCGGGGALGALSFVGGTNFFFELTSQKGGGSHPNKGPYFSVEQAHREQKKKKKKKKVIAGGPGEGDNNNNITCMKTFDIGII